MSSYELPIGLRLGSYELLARIGEGGMGSVYAAVHVGLGKRVAIKTLRAELAEDADVRARFVREGKAAVAVRHPNVVDIDDVGVHENMPYLVMELLDGENLHAFITRRERLTVQETADIVVPVLSAMAESHRAGVVHRDLKPDNIFLARGAGGLPVPKVLDFGISKLRETHSAGLTGDNALLGTPYYMAPEQASSARDVDARSDLYAIGVILYHAISGRVPFMGGSLAQVIGQILHATAIPLSESVPGIPPAFEAMVARLMEKDPARRYQDAHSLGQALLVYASERIALTYRSEFGAAAAGGVYNNTPAVPPPLAAGIDTTLRSAARSVSTTVPVHYSSPLWRRLGWPVLGVLALIGAALAYWQRAPEPRETAIDSVLRPADRASAAHGAEPSMDGTRLNEPKLGEPPPGAVDTIRAVEADTPQLKAADSRALPPTAATPQRNGAAEDETPQPPAAEAIEPDAPRRSRHAPSAKTEPGRVKEPTRPATPKPARANTKPTVQPKPQAADEDLWGNRK